MIWDFCGKFPLIRFSRMEPVRTLQETTPFYAVWELATAFRMAERSVNVDQLTMGWWAQPRVPEFVGDQAGAGNDTLWVSMNSRSPSRPISRPIPLLRSPPNGARSSRKAGPWLFTQV
jgi:hypothetical protein